MTKCPYCAEEILEDAVKCKHCHEWLNESKTMPLAESPSDSVPVTTSPALRGDHPVTGPAGAGKRGFRWGRTALVVGLILAAGGGALVLLDTRSEQGSSPSATTVLAVPPSANPPSLPATPPSTAGQAKPVAATPPPDPVQVARSSGKLFIKVVEIAHYDSGFCGVVLELVNGTSVPLVNLTLGIEVVLPGGKLRKSKLGSLLGGTNARFANTVRLGTQAAVGVQPGASTRVEASLTERCKSLTGLAILGVEPTFEGPESCYFQGFDGPRNGCLSLLAPRPDSLIPVVIVGN